MAKGCITCHAGSADGFSPHGLDLSGRRFPETYLKKLLADPQAIRGSESEMPKLDLNKSEIGALTAFINSGQLR
jgi:mono/diheme cytochrome c family protein